MRVCKLLELLFFLIYNFANSNGYRILGIYPFVGKSHYIMINQLFRGLARKGHQVDVITPFPQKNLLPNYTQIFQFPDTTSQIMDNLNFDVIKEFSEIRNLSTIADIGYKMCENIGMPEFLKLAREPPKDQPYDVIVSQLFNAHCYAILGHLWNKPVVLVSTSALYPWMHDVIGNPENVAFSPNNFSPVAEGNGLFSRLFNAYMFYWVKLNYLYHSTRINELLKIYFGPKVPTVRELERNVSLVLMNTYFPINGVKPMTTGLVEVGGLHIQNDGPDLNSDLKGWLDQSTNGVIYFSLGSILRIEIFLEETIQIIFEILKKLAPIRILMRVVDPSKLPMKIPKNFYTLPWMPQEKILQHPNVKVFVTHGGLLGTQESIFYAVPMLCLPVFADQRTNTQNYLQKKIAVSANIMSLTRKEFDNAVSEVLHNPIYRDNVRKLSRLFRDRPLDAMDTAAFWIEFVVRNGKDGLRSPAMDLTWWQVELLDVAAVAIAALLGIIFVVLFVIRMTWRFLFRKTNLRALNQKKND